ncbi:DoxX family membrane protein [Snuella sedimenti]|uniref:DoxX family protein n=1 Tax=Snuella sedimenti TaxID=2798802 RepID=A0A8J7LP89_9FLAO|nr:DoxX family membrane protein [Snuella sedimenti]MBJ6369013.1 DoxX family protein [Snuella sedimenti]
MKEKLTLILRITVAIILLQTLRFKFSAHPDSVYIFTKVGMEPFGRISIGIIELIASILILIPKTIWIGALLTLGVIGGAIIMHLSILGIQVNNDNGLLFLTAVVTFILSIIILYKERHRLPKIKAS